ncbi:unnamed protein product [Oikopleura dioica]|uniref:Mannosyltransferase n=1 Tax=Oikopleura dioica TaxID=34765 RepID=E4YG12_OIKDI|nr:unnamed protein product [Oikopleura dioica]
MEWSIVIYQLTISAHVFMAPFTKVEESFYLQAAHDFIYEDSIESFDHRKFPGVVPRTAAPNFILSSIIRPFKYLLDKPSMQILLRLLLGFCTSYSLSKITEIIKKKISPAASFLFLLTTVSQPHLMFYASRTLPNSIALPIVLYAFSCWPLGNEPAKFIALSAFAILTIRCELALLMGSFLIMGLLTREISFGRLFVVGFSSTFVSLVATVPFDSWFWGQLIWPEGQVFIFNAIEGKSSAWGVMPFLWYFKSALPRACLTSLLFIPFGFLQRPQTSMRLLLPSLFFIFIYSFNPHKELRFIFYVFPLLNIISAFGLEFFHQKRANGSFIWRWIWSGVFGSVVINFLGTTLFAAISAINYPGGQAIEKLHDSVPCEFNVSVHMTNLALQSGVSRFGQLCENWEYDKSEELSYEEILKLNFTHLILENNEETVMKFTEHYRNIGVVPQYSHIKIG